MSNARRYAAADAFLRGHDDNWAELIRVVGPCCHDPKAAREPYEALVRAMAYQQLTARAGDAMIDRLRLQGRDHTGDRTKRRRRHRADARRRRSDG
jgi:DNA-3-methyladenine glycosylase II